MHSILPYIVVMIMGASLFLAAVYHRRSVPRIVYSDPDYTQLLDLIMRYDGGPTQYVRDITAHVDRAKTVVEMLAELRLTANVLNDIGVYFDDKEIVALGQQAAIAGRYICTHASSEQDTSSKAAGYIDTIRGVLRERQA